MRIALLSYANYIASALIDTCDHQYVFVLFGTDPCVPTLSRSKLTFQCFSFVHVHCSCSVNLASGLLRQVASIFLFVLRDRLSDLSDVIVEKRVYDGMWSGAKRHR